MFNPVCSVLLEGNLQAMHRFEPMAITGLDQCNHLVWLSLHQKREMVATATSEYPLLQQPLLLQQDGGPAAVVDMAGQGTAGWVTAAPLLPVNSE
jgi:hypothetical protein